MLLDIGDFILYVIVLPLLTTVGILLTAFGIAQLVGAGKTVPFLKSLPVFKASIFSISISVPLTLVVGLGLFALVAVLIEKTREVVIEL